MRRLRNTRGIPILVADLKQEAQQYFLDHGYALQHWAGPTIAREFHADLSKMGDYAALSELTGVKQGTLKAWMNIYGPQRPVHTKLKARKKRKALRVFSPVYARRTQRTKQQEMQIIKRWRSGMSASEATGMFQGGHALITKLRAKYGAKIVPHHPRKGSGDIERHMRMIALWQTGATAKEATGKRTTNLAQSVIKDLRRMYGVEQIPYRPGGKMIPKYTEADEQEIIRRLQAGASPRQATGARSEETARSILGRLRVKYGEETVPRQTLKYGRTPAREQEIITRWNKGEDSKQATGIANRKAAMGVIYDLIKKYGPGQVISTNENKRLRGESPIADRIYGILAASRRPMTASELASMVGAHESRVLVVAHEMAESRLIERTKIRVPTIGRYSFRDVYAFVTLEQ